MRGAMVGVLGVLVVAAFSSAGCSHRSKKHEKESLAITTTTLRNATEGVAYSYTLSASGGNSSNYNWSISGQPSWLSINSSTGELSGTPPAGSAGSYSFTVSVTDGQGTVSKQFDLVVNPAAGVTWYVDATNGSDSNGGTSWSDAFATIAKALSVAGDNDLVLVADATYNETDLNFNGKEIYLKGVDHNTSGAQPVIDCQGNGRAFYFGSGETKDSVIDNFVIRNGKVEDTYGGAIVCENNSSPTITNCVFQNNKTEDMNGTQECEDGGAIYCSCSSPTVINCTFSGNSASGSGGAIYYDYASSLTVTNCTFCDNSASDDGGAIYCYSSSPAIIDCTFSGNSATGNSSCGGAIECYNNSSPSITDCTFSSNTATSQGGAIDCATSSNPSITNCAFHGNSATAAWSASYGGAIACTNSSPSVTDSTFSDNSAYYYGGAIYCGSSNATVRNCTFSGNSANRGGGVIYCIGGSPTVTNCTFSGNSAKWGGAVHCIQGSLTLTNSTFSANNAGDYGGAVCCYYHSNATLNNCILWGNSAVTSGSEIHINDSASSCTLNSCCVDNTDYGGQTGNITENNCIHQDPQFVDAANADYRLKDTSPCIDRGNNSLLPSGVDKDLDGNQRVVDGDNDGTPVVDIGAYEYQP